MDDSRGTVAVDPGPADAPGGSEAPRPRGVRVARLVGILVPLAVIAWVVTVRPLSFDGAMNLQVALSLVTDGTYSRSYGGEVIFPSEIQTSSYFLFVSAAGIAIFGPATFGFQAGGLAFAAGLLTALSWALPRRRVLLALGPGLLFFATPGLLWYTVDGYGEGAVAGLVLGSFTLLAAAVTDARPLRKVVAAFTLVGVAVSVKTVAVAAGPVALVALVVVARTRGRPVRTTAWAAGAAAVPFAIFEVYRWVTLGPSGYAAWWSFHVGRVRLQATGTGLAGPEVDRVAKVADHFHLLSGHTLVAAEWWLALLVVLPLLAGALLLLGRRTELPPETRRVALTALYALGYGLLYAAWWLAVTSTEKAWLRRITIGLLALALAGVLLTWLVAKATITRTGPTAIRLTAVALAAVVGLVLVLVAVATVPRNVRWMTAPSEAEGLTELATAVAELDEVGAELYGLGWWSAPVVSLYSGVDLENLGTTAVCESPVREVIESGSAFLIWDQYAQGLRSPEPSFRGVTFVATDVVTYYGTIWQVELLDDTC